MQGISALIFLASAIVLVGQTMAAPQDGWIGTMLIKDQKNLANVDLSKEVAEGLTYGDLVSLNYIKLEDCSDGALKRRAAIYDIALRESRSNPQIAHYAKNFKEMYRLALKFCKEHKNEIMAQNINGRASFD